MAPDRSLDDALASLRGRGVLTDRQVEAIMREIREEPPLAVAAPSTRNVIPEILGYVGAALVLAAGLSLVVRQWESWTAISHLWVSAGAAAVLYVTAIALTFALGGRTMLNEPRRGTVRRVVGVLVTLAVPLVALATLSSIEVARSSTDWEWSGIVIGSAAFTAAALGAWWVRGALLTIAVAAAGLALGMTVFGEIDMRGPNWIAPLLAVVIGAGWIWIAPRILAVPILAEALGFAWLIITLTPTAMENQRAEDAPFEPSIPTDILVAAWVARGLLVAVAVIAMTGFARGRTWPWAAGGVIAGVFAALSIGQGALGWITGLFIAGVVLLALSGLMIFLRTRRESHMRSGADTPHSSRPLNST